MTLEDGKITLKTKTGKITTFPLTNLSEADRAIAEKLAATPPAAGVGESKASARAKVREFTSVKNGIKTKTRLLEVEVELVGADAASAFAVAPAVAEPALVGGEALAPEKPIIPDQYEMIDRKQEGIFAEHPKGGVRAELLFGELPEGGDTVELVRGEIPVFTGGEPQAVVVKDVEDRQPGPIEDAALTAAGLELSFGRHDEGESVSFQLTVPKNSKVFESFDVIDADGKPVETIGSGSASGAGVVSRSISVPKEALGGASLRIHIRIGAREMNLPFEATGVAIGE